jgi:hypothetical protein
MFYPNQLLSHMHVSLVDVLQQRRLELGPDEAATLVMRGYVVRITALEQQLPAPCVAEWGNRVSKWFGQE